MLDDSGRECSVGAYVVEELHFAAAQHQRKTELARVIQPGDTEVFRQLDGIFDTDEVECLDRGDIERSTKRLHHREWPVEFPVIVIRFVTFPFGSLELCLRIVEDGFREVAL